MLNGFVNTGLDQRIVAEVGGADPREELSKAMDKRGLVQREITVNGKNGTFTRKQWVKATDADKKDTKATPKVDLGDCSKAAIAKALKNGATKQQVMDAAKAAGITWKENSHEGINWMRASMAIQKAGVTAQSSTNAVDPAKDAPAKDTPTKGKPVKEPEKAVDDPRDNMIPDPNSMSVPEFNSTEFCKDIQAQAASLNDSDKVPSFKVEQMAQAIAAVKGGYKDSVTIGVDKGTSRRGMSNDDYKLTYRNLAKLAKANGLECRVYDSTTHSSGYVGARGQRVYAQTYPKKTLVVYSKEPNKQDFDDFRSEGDNVIFIDDNGKSNHGFIVRRSAEWKPGTALVEVSDSSSAATWGRRLKEVSLKDIKGIYSRNDKTKPQFNLNYKDQTQEMLKNAVIKPENKNVTPKRIIPEHDRNTPVNAADYQIEDKEAAKKVKKWADSIEKFKEKALDKEKPSMEFYSMMKDLQKELDTDNLTRDSRDPELFAAVKALKERQDKVHFSMPSRQRDRRDKPVKVSDFKFDDYAFPIKRYNLPSAPVKASEVLKDVSSGVERIYKEAQTRLIPDEYFKRNVANLKDDSGYKQLPDSGSNFELQEAKRAIQSRINYLQRQLDDKKKK